MFHCLFWTSWHRFVWCDLLQWSCQDPFPASPSLRKIFHLFPVSTWGEVWGCPSSINGTQSIPQNIRQHGSNGVSANKIHNIGRMTDWLFQPTSMLGSPTSEALTLFFMAKVSNNLLPKGTCFPLKRPSMKTPSVSQPLASALDGKPGFFAAEPMKNPLDQKMLSWLAHLSHMALIWANQKQHALVWCRNQKDLMVWHQESPSKPGQQNGARRDARSGCGSVHCHDGFVSPSKYQARGREVVKDSDLAARDGWRRMKVHQPLQPLPLQVIMKGKVSPVEVSIYLASEMKMLVPADYASPTWPSGASWVEHFLGTIGWFHKVCSFPKLHTDLWWCARKLSKAKAHELS